MSLLTGLRLNCLLVPVVLVVVALAAVWSIWWLAAAAAAAEERQDAAQVLAIAARLDPTGDGARIRAADPRWSGIAVIAAERDRLVELSRTGRLGLAVDDPAPDLVLAAHGPLAWRENGGVIAAAAPLRKADGLDVALLYGERPATPPDFALPVVASCLLILFGGALGWYLAARIYAPVEWLTKEAEDALAGRQRRGGERSSRETGELRSSILVLTDRYRSGTHRATTATESSGDAS